MFWFKFQRYLAAALAMTMLHPVLASAQRENKGKGGVDVTQVGKWPTDVIVFKGRDGDLVTIEGLIRNHDDQRVEILQVGRDPRRRMYLLVRWIPRDRIQSTVLINDAERRELKKRIFAFRKRTKISADLRDQIELKPYLRERTEYQHYVGPWFTLDSTADEPLTREAIVRVEQMVAGFRTFIRPRKEPRRPPRFVLLNTPQQYEQYQQQAGVNLQHSAFFDPHRNEIVAGGELAALNEAIKEVTRHHKELQQEYLRLERELESRLTELTAAMTAAGKNRKKITQVRIAARVELDKRIKPQRIKIRMAERANEVAMQRKFRVLYHEAFHGYLENYVFDKTKHNVPRWINEGLAQVFENGMLDAGTLRLDTPDPFLLEALQRELKAEDPLSLVAVLTAPEEQFLVQHADVARRTKGLYLFSWGLAYYLMFDLKVLDSEALDQYLSTNGRAAHPVVRFESFVGMTMEAFEAEWREAILGYGT